MPLPLHFFYLTCSIRAHLKYREVTENHDWLHMEMLTLSCMTGTERPKVGTANMQMMP